MDEMQHATAPPTEHDEIDFEILLHATDTGPREDYETPELDPPEAS